MNRRRFSEAMAIGFCTAGGLLITSSIVLLIVGGGSSSPERGADATHAGLIGCGPSGMAVSCLGRF